MSSHKTRRSLALLAVAVVTSGLTARDGDGTTVRARQAFESNQGQSSQEFAFATRGDGFELRLGTVDTELLLPASPGNGGGDEVLRLSYPGARTAPVVGVEPLPGKVHYLIGSEPERWLTNIPTFAAVGYDGLYPGVSLVLRSDFRDLEFTYVIAAGADPGVIRLGVDGLASLETDRASGDLILRTMRAEMRGTRPSAWQESGSVTQDVGVEYATWGGSQVGLLIPKYDADRPITVSMRLRRSESPGAAVASDAVRIALDSGQNVYFTGRVRLGQGPGHAFVSKLAAEGGAPLYTTYFGGNGEDVPLGITVDDAGEVLLTGWTSSATFPIVGGLQRRLAGRSDAFVVKLAADGSRLLYSTYLGGAGEDSARAIARDATGSAWVTGRTRGAGFPATADALQPGSGGLWDAFVSRLSPDGASLLYSTFLGGSGDDEGNAIAVDGLGKVHLAGAMRSHDSRSSDAFAATLSADGTRLLSETRLGGKGDDAAAAIDVDAFGATFIAGRTESPDFPADHRLVTSDLEETVGQGRGDAFVAKLDAEGKALLYATRLGGTSDDEVLSIAADARGSAWIAGVTSSSDFPSARGDRTHLRGSRDGFLAEIGPGGDALLRSVLIGGEGDDAAFSVAAAQAGIVAAGVGRSADLPSIQPVQAMASGGRGFVGSLPGSLDSAASAGCPGTINFDNTSGDGLWQTASNWDTNVLPGPADDVCIGPGFSVTLSSGTQTVNTLFVSATASLAMTAGTLNLTAASQSDGPFSVSGTGTLGGAATLTINGAATWTGGTMTGAGRTKTSGGLTIGTSAMTLSGGRILENPTGSTVTMTANLTIPFNSAATIENAGLWDIQNDADLTDSGGSGTRTFTNTGTLRKSAGTGVTSIGTANFSLNNTSPGAVQIQSGTIALSAGTHTGSLSISSGATLQLTGTATFNSAASVTGAGAVSVTAGTSTFNTGSTCAPAGTTTIAGGTLNFNAGATATPGSLAISSGTLGGAADVTIIGATTWTGGTMTGTGRTKTSGGLTIGTSAVTLSGGRILENPSGSTATMTANLALAFNTSATVQNAGVWDIQNDADVTDGGGGGTRTITNTGTLRKSAGTGVTSIGATTGSFNNTAPGSIEVQSGTFALSVGTHTGTLSISGGATLQLTGSATFNLAASVTGAGVVSVTGGTNNFNTGTSYAPAGTTTVSGGTLNFNTGASAVFTPAVTMSGSGSLNFSTGAPMSLPGLSLSGTSTLGGTDQVTVIGATTWTGGTMTGAGRTKVTGGLTIGTSAVTLSSGRILENPSGSTVTMTANLSLSFNTSATVENAGLWDIQNDADITDGGGSGTRTFTNTGTVRKSAGTGVTSIGTATFSLSNTAPGSIEVQSGTLTLSAGSHTGSLSISGGATLQLTGTATFNSAASVTGAGAVSVTAGTSTFNAGSNYAPAGTTTIAGGTLNLNTGVAVSPGSLVISSGTLGGTDTVTVIGATTWTGGTMTGTGRTKTSGGLTIGTNTVTMTGGRILENPTGSTATMTATLSLSFNTSATVENAGLWDIQNDADITDGGGSGTRTFTNTGTLRKSAGTGVTSIGSGTFSLSNTAPGSIEVQSGTLTLSAGTHTGTLSISGGATLQLTGSATFNLAASVTGAGVVSVTGGTNNFNTGTSYAPAGTTTVSGGTLNFNTGAAAMFTQPATISNSGTLNFGTGAPASLPGLSLSGAGTLGGTDTVTVIGATTWTGGTMTGTGRTKTSGGLAIGTSGVTLFGGRILENPSGSTATMTANVSLAFNSPATIENAGLWDIQNDADFTDGGGTGPRTITNTGTFRKSAGTGITSIGASTSFNNTAPGSIEIQSGTLALSAGTHTGTLSISGGATLQLTGSATFNSAASVTGAGAVSVTGGTNNLNTGTSYAPAGTTAVSGGTLNFNTGASAVFTQPATISGSGTLNLGTGAPASLPGLSLSGTGTLGGTDQVTVIGATTWTGGTMTGTGRTKTSGGLAIGTNAVTLTGGRILENPSGSTATMTANMSLSFNTSATVENAGVWDIQNDADLTDGGGTGTRAITNTGTFRKSAGAGITSVGSPFDNTAPGSIEIQSGTLALSAGTHTGSIAISGGATLQLTGSATFNSAASVTGAGAVSVTGGTNNFNTGTSYAPAGTTTVSVGTLNFNAGASATPGSLAISSGTLGGAADVTISGATTWTGGTMTGTGRTKTSGGLTIGTNTVTMTGGRILENPTGSTATMTANLSLSFNTSATVENAGVWDIQNDADFTDGGGSGTRTIMNTGTFRKSAGTGVTGVGNSTSFSNAGIVEALAGTLQYTGAYAQTAGSTTVNGGILSSTTPLNIQGGILAGSGTVTANVTSAGQVAPGLSPGSLTISGNYTQSAAGATNVEIGGLVAGTQYDVLHVAGTGVATLSGTLNASFIGGFVPVDTNAFTVLTYASRSGTFSTLNLPPLPPAHVWKVTYNPTSLVLEVTQDSDGDGQRDLADCAPFDAGAFAAPAELTGDQFASDRQTFSWNSAIPSSGPATVHDVIRGTLGQFPIGSGGETCLTPPAGIAGSSIVDPTMPPAGGGFFYLVRARNVCGTGTYGFATGGAERITTTCP